MKDLTIVLLNYKRQNNILKILASLASQSVIPQIFLWNNAEIPFFDSRVDWLVNSSVNKFCYPRWFLAARAKTEFVAVLDDDLNVNSDIFVKILIDYLASLNSQVGIIGLEGVLLNERHYYYPQYDGRLSRTEIPSNYNGTVHLAGTTKDFAVDIVKGRFMVCRTTDLQALPLSPLFKDVCDDIIISSLLRKTKNPSHLIPGWLSQNFIDLPEKNGSMALSAQSTFKTLRQRATDFYFPTEF